FCLRHSRSITSLVLHEPTPGALRDPDIVRQQIAGELDSIALFCPSRADEPGFREWFTRAGHAGASPRLAVRAYALPSDGAMRDIERASALVSFPVLVLRRPAAAFSPPPHDDPFVELVAGARRVDIPGVDRLAYGGEVDVLVAEIARFVTGEYRPPEPDR